MFKAIRITVLLLILFFVAASNWLTQSRSTDWNNSLWVKIYPINGDGSDVSGRYVDSLTADSFEPIESFVAREVSKYGHSIARPVRVELGEEIREQPPAIGDSPSALDIMLWSLKMRWWASSFTGPQDDPDPDVRVSVRYHAPEDHLVLEDSDGMQKGMIGVVNAYEGRRQAGTNNVIIAHEFLHTLGATDKYDPANGMPDFPIGFAEPDRQPRFPQRLAEIMGGRIAISPTDAMVPKSLDYVTIGAQTAEEIRLIK